MTTIYTAGHGNRELSEFVALLNHAGIERLVDVRAYPASRRNLQFGREALAKGLVGAGIRYMWEGEALGGRRRGAERSRHTALRNASFRAYADHMMGPDYQAALERLIALARGRPTAVMCAERLPWRCHRYLIADSLVARDLSVVHLVAERQRLVHTRSTFSRTEGNILIYDVTAQSDLGL